MQSRALWVLETDTGDIGGAMNKCSKN